jgi:hypothetical protein
MRPSGIQRQVVSLDHRDNGDISTSKTSVYFYETTQSHIPDDCQFHTYCSCLLLRLLFSFPFLFFFHSPPFILLFHLCLYLPFHMFVFILSFIPTPWVAMATHGRLRSYAPDPVLTLYTPACCQGVHCDATSSALLMHSSAEINPLISFSDIHVSRKGIPELKQQQHNSRACIHHIKSSSSSSSSSCSYQGVVPFVETFRSHASTSLFNGLPWFLLPFVSLGNLLRNSRFTYCIHFLL